MNFILTRVAHIYLCSNFSGGLRINFVVTARVAFRFFKVTDFGTNRKRVCNFLLVRHSYFGWFYLAPLQMLPIFVLVVMGPITILPYYPMHRPQSKISITKNCSLFTMIVVYELYFAMVALKETRKPS